ncbi:MAG: hypothetical protein L0312_33780 [Acidobacteria bacterium]|nr:hypothetical protein [Acidobacteriota bacterium]
MRIAPPALFNGSSQPEINLHLLSGLAFDAPHPLRLPLLKSPHEATNRSIGALALLVVPNR